MPDPKPDSEPKPKKQLIIFVHGFASSAESWGDMIRVLGEDKDVSGQFDTRVFDYSTALSKISLVRRLPKVEEIGKNLSVFIDNELAAATARGNSYVHTILVGHSMGGLVIQAYILDTLQSSRGRDLDQLRQVLLFATPNFGSPIFGRLRSLLFSILPNPQERSLRPFSDLSHHIHEQIRTDVIDAKLRDKREYPLPFTCFWGDTDNAVSRESARGHFLNAFPVPGGHNDLHTPKGVDDQRYVRFKEAILRPYGHGNVWEIEQFFYETKVSPCSPGSNIEANYGDNHLRRVEYNNFGRVKRQVRFAAHNQCRAPFTLRYATRNNGWIKYSLFGGADVASTERRRQYEDSGTEVHSEVIPQDGKEFTLSLDVYKGFDEGHRDCHFHLGRLSYYRRVRCVLDLADYLVAGWTLRHSPKFYYHPVDPENHQMCGGRELLNPEPPTATDAVGIWQWDLEFVKEGVLDIMFDLCPPATPNENVVVRLRPSEHAIFGFGPLLSLSNIEHTLGKKYSAAFVECELSGWRRSWDCAVRNTKYVYRENGQWVSPERILYLNMKPAPNGTVNGVLFVVSDAELNDLDHNESMYERIDVGDSLVGVRVEGGPAWAYVAKNENLLAPPSSPTKAAIRKSYFQIIEDAKKSLGDQFAHRYAYTSDAVPPGLVVDDRRRDELQGI